MVYSIWLDILRGIPLVILYYFADHDVVLVDA
jgi:hypothetical protein